VWTEFAKLGRLLWEAGLIHLTSGNMSVRRGGTLLITRTGASLADLAESDLVEVDAAGPARDRGASSETPVHRALYLWNPGAGAVVHAHPPYATTLSFDAEEIAPEDSDRLIIPRIPVLTECGHEEGSACAAAKLPARMGGMPVGMIRGHGAFAVGANLYECVARLTMMENQCRLLFLRRTLGARR
jgi:L-fuculose-phosphate aldolase